MQEEAETVLVPLSRRQVERSPAVVVSSGHVNPLQEHPLESCHVPGHRGEQEGHHAGPGVLEGVSPWVELVGLALDRLHLVELVEVEAGDELLTELDPPHGVAQRVQGRRPESHRHEVGNHQQDAAAHTGLGRQTDLRYQSVSFYGLISQYS